jgi:hypothetical protein
MNNLLVNGVKIQNENIYFKCVLINLKTYYKKQNLSVSFNWRLVMYVFIHLQKGLISPNSAGIIF